MSIGDLPDPINSPSSRIGQRMGLDDAARTMDTSFRTVSASGPAKATPVEDAEKMVQALRDVNKEAEKFTRGGGKKFADMIREAADAAGRIRNFSPSTMAGGTSIGDLYARHKESREQAAGHLAASRGAPSRSNVYGGGGTPTFRTVGENSNPWLPGSQVSNGGASAGQGIPGRAAGGGSMTVNATNVVVNGGGGSGGNGGQGGQQGENGGGAAFGGVRRVASAAAAVIGAQAMYRVQQSYQNERGAFMAKGFGMQAIGAGTIGGQQAQFRALQAAGGRGFDAMDEATAARMAARTMGGTNFNMATLASFQTADPLLSLSDSAGIGAELMSPQVRNAMYAFGGVNTRGMDASQIKTAAASVVFGGRTNFTEADYNALGTPGSNAYVNAQRALGLSSEGVGALQAFVGQQAGVVGAERARSENAALASELDREIAQRGAANEMLDEMADQIKLVNSGLIKFYETLQGNPLLQRGAAGVGAAGGFVASVLGAAGLGRLVKGGGGGGSVPPNMPPPTAGTQIAGRATPMSLRVAQRLGRLSKGAPLVGTAISGGISLYNETREGGTLTRGRVGDIRSLGDAYEYSREVADAWKWGNAPLAAFSRLSGMAEDIGDPPEGSNIRTSKPASHVTGLSGTLRSALERMFRDNPRLRLNSGYRSVEHQRRLWNDALKKYGSAEKARKWVAPPGKSNHNRGLAADIGPRSEYDWIKRNASKYGLSVPLGNEPWHVEPLGTRSGKEIVDINVQSSGSDVASGKDGNGGGRAEERGLAAFFGDAQQSEGALIASLLGGGSSVAAPSAPGTVSQGRSTGSLSGADQAMVNSAITGGAGAGFGGTFRDKAIAIGRVAKQAGFRGDALTTAIAIALGESSGNPSAVGDVSLQTDKWGPSIGLWQVRSLKNPQNWSGVDGRRVASKLYDPQYNAQMAYDLYRQRGGFRDWSVYNDGIYHKYLDEASYAVGQIGDPPGSGADAGGVDGSGGRMVVDKGGNRTVNMTVVSNGDAHALAMQVMRILNEKDALDSVGAV